MTSASSLTLRKFGLAGLAGLACLVAPQAQAQLREGDYGYAGFGVGRTSGSLGTSSQVAAGLGVGGSVTDFTRDRHDTAYKVFGGWQFNRNLAIEGGYFDLGKTGYRAITVPAGPVDAQFKVQGLNLDLVGTLPLTTNLSALGRIGVTAARTRARFVETGAAAMADTSRRDTNAKLGLGLQYAFGSTVLVRAEIERYRASDAQGGHANMNVASLGLVFPFGAAPAATPRAAAPYVAPMAAAPVAAPAPAPAVVVQAPPPAPPRRRVTFSAESLFGFDRSVVNAEGMTALDQFARELDGTTFDMVVVEGHTDRLGSTSYNQTLSQQRAEAVKNYLVSSGHVDPMKVSANGRSESMPVTKPEDCVGTKATALLIACLRPDRRVDVDVVGTR
jgi:OmpA-OmpF porin, OOP family